MPPTLTRISQWERPHVDSRAGLSAWSVLDVHRFVKGVFVLSPLRAAGESHDESGGADCRFVERAVSRRPLRGSDRKLHAGDDFVNWPGLRTRTVASLCPVLRRMSLAQRAISSAR